MNHTHSSETLPKSITTHGEKNKKTLYVSFITSFFLLLGKSILGFFSGSIALISSAIDSFMDMLSTLVNIFILKESLKPADKDHPFGHGKYEAFSGLIQGIILFILSGSLIIYSLLHFNSPRDANLEFIGIFIVIVSIISPLILSAFIKKQSQNSHSLVMEAEHAHFFSDSIMNGGVLFSLLFSYFFHISWIDSVVGILIACWLIFQAFELEKSSFNILVDKELSDDIQEEIKNILNSSPEISHWHALRTRRSGTEYHIDIHLEFPEDISLKKAHIASDVVEERIMKKFPNAIILTHFDFENDL